MVARYQEPALAAMEGRFETGAMAEIALIGQPNVRERRLENPIRVPGLLSFLAFGTFHADVRGLDAFPEEPAPALTTGQCSDSHRTEYRHGHHQNRSCRGRREQGSHASPLGDLGVNALLRDLRFLVTGGGISKRLVPLLLP
jgi:cytochrome bd-type quinol oxidase subunit 1